MKKKPDTAGEPAENGQLSELRALVADTPVENVTNKKTNRRNMLRLAGAALIGAAGAAAVRVVPAAAANGSYMLVGCAHSGTGSTSLQNTSTTAAGGAAFQALGPNGLRGGGQTTVGTDEVGVLGASKSGSGPGTGVQGQAGTGVGVLGNATSGTAGLFVSTTGVDVALGQALFLGQTGSGRLSMVGRTDVGAAAPSFAPAFVVHSTLFTGEHYQHEFVRGNDASIWASRAAATFPGAAPSKWKRINTVRVDSVDGTGAVYKPFRLVDTRFGTGGQGGVKANGSTTSWTVAGAGGTGTSKIPEDAIAVVGNLTATGFTNSGFFAIFPFGAAFNPAVDPSAVNFTNGQVAIANSFVIGLSGGKLSVYVSINGGTGSSHIIIDITGYIQ